MRVSRPVRFAFALALLAGCRNHSAPTRPVTNLEQRIPQDSPEDCLLGLMTAYVQRDLPGYVALFSRDFRFVFSPADVFNPSSPAPTIYPLLADSASTDSLFHSELVDKIELTWEAGTAVNSDSIWPGTSLIRLNNINLLIYTRQAGAPWIYRVAGGSASLYFREYPDERANNGQPLWRIWRWEDEPISLRPGRPAEPLVQEMTWGRIKLRFAPRLPVPR